MNNLTKNKVIVYCTINNINKYIYVGVHLCKSLKFDGYIGCGVYINQPSSYNHPKTKFQAAVQEFGPNNFKRITLQIFDKESDAYELESEIVNEEFLKRKDVYNQVIGGHGGDLANNAKPCYQYDLNGNYVNEYKSEQKAAIAVNRCFTVIKRAIKYKIKSANYFWSESKYDKLDLSEYKTTDNKILIFQYSYNGEYDCCYESVSDAARCNNCTSSNICRACKLGYKVNNKYFSYIFKPTFDKARQININHVYQYSLSGEYIAEYNSCNEAEKILNVSRGLSTAIKLGRTFHNYQWRIEKLDKIDSVEVKCQARKVGQYDLQGNLIKIFKTVTECKKEFSGCQHVLQGRNKTSGGFTFKYIE